MVANIRPARWRERKRLENRGKRMAPGNLQTKFLTEVIEKSFLTATPVSVS
jgi:hypothetical protein